ncbi:undecaprenyldiphospho-muramoylpentapeptide beta-N-acetylglucosaminyltransferase [Marinobacteraceae bacterium S3BR75-40.1]
MSAKRFLIMAGGTGGHVFPALATARRLQELGHEVHWLGSVNGMESRLVSDAGLPLSLIHVSGLRGKGRVTLLAAPFRLLRAVMEAVRVLRQVRPDCVIGMGGFASGPGGLAAWLMRKPLVIHEQNAVAGMTNRLLSRFATTVLEAFPNSFNKETVTRYTGNPVRSELADMPEPAERFAERTGPTRLLVLGGSLGARPINEALPQAIEQIPEAQRPEILHQCGRNHVDAARDAYENVKVKARVEPFIKDMAEAYGWADLVVCRAGALTVAELCAVGVGAILVPLPHAVDDHQTRNSEHMTQGGAGYLVPQDQFGPSHVAALLGELLPDRERLRSLAEAARKLARPDATERVVNYCLEAAHG